MSVHGNIEPLSWESEFFQLSSARLHVNQAAIPLNEAQLRPFVIVQAKIAAHQLGLADALYRLGFRLAEGEVDLSLTVNLDDTSSLPLQQRVAQEQDIAWLRQQAADAFVLSRFREPWYQAGDSARFYAAWVENAVRATFDDQCLLALGNQGQVQGFVTLRQLEGQQARIGLLATAKEYIGQGVGRHLMQIAQQWCRERSINRLLVATQTGNVAALRLYMRSGAQITATSYWLYR